MINENVLTVVKIIKAEMIAIWAYLDAFNQLFSHTNSDYIKLYEKTSPGLFALIQTSLIESAFSRLTRLMDPPQSCRKDNLNYATLCSRCKEDSNFKSICDLFSEINKEWKNGKFKKLREHRNKVHSHNDFSTIKTATPLVTSNLTADDINIIQELFEKLWEILGMINLKIYDSALLKPTYGALNQKPKAIIPYLKLALQMQKVISENPELLLQNIKSTTEPNRGN